jgi:N-acetylmuramoyl-L-alanine amidase
MKRSLYRRNEASARTAVFASIFAVAFALLFAFPAQADLKTDARNQFEHAVKMRTTLEGYLERDRSLDDYKRTVLAYRKVYLITPDTELAAPALVAEGELYQEMGRLFDSMFFQTAIERYKFLLKQYPGSHYRSDALFTIGQIQRNNLNKPDDAETSFKEFAKRFPRSEKAGDVQAALKGIADQRSAPVAKPDQPGPDLQGQAVEPRVSERRSAAVTELHTWHGEDSTRIVVDLNDTIKYDAVRIPNRIYFDLYKARLGSRLLNRQLDVDNGLLKTIRVAQNKPDVVRVVLDVNGAKDYSAFLLANPYRLVIDVHSKAAGSQAKEVAAAPAANTDSGKTAANTPSIAIATPVAANNDTTVRPAPQAEKISVKSADSSPKATAKSNTKLVETAVEKDKSAALPGNPDLKHSVTAELELPPVAAERPKPKTKTFAALLPPPEPKPTRDGQRSLTRALGLKISRIVIDPGHGGHDTGTIGPHGLMEKDLCLDVALRLGTLIEQKLPAAEVVFTRKDDTFIPLEERTAIANEAKADLFISIHANSSHDDTARGIETYYLNFATSAESMEVASRENAMAQESLHDLQDLIKKIARNEKLEESKELASDVQDSLTQRLQLVSHGERNRGVKKAPFVVLIGADMPSVLSEISFVSNPNDEKLLRKTDQRERIADGLYRGISSYLDSLNSLSNNQQKLVSDNPVETGAIASNGSAK